MYLRHGTAHQWGCGLFATRPQEALYRTQLNTPVPLEVPSQVPSGKIEPGEGETRGGVRDSGQGSRTTTGRSAESHSSHAPPAGPGQLFSLPPTVFTHAAWQWGGQKALDVRAIQQSQQCKPMRAGGTTGENWDNWQKSQPDEKRNSQAKECRGVNRNSACNLRPRSAIDEGQRH